MKGVKGGLVHRGENRWALVIDVGRVADPKRPGMTKRKQQWKAFRGTKPEAIDALADLVRAEKRGENAAPSKVTVTEHLRRWLKLAAPDLRPASRRVFDYVVERVAREPLGALPLQKVRPSDIRTYYTTLSNIGRAKHRRGLPVSAETVRLHRTVINLALQQALDDRLISWNPAPRVKRRKKSAAAKKPVFWTADEARAVLQAAADASPQVRAFVRLALDSGARKSELCGLQWKHLDLDAARVTIEQQLDDEGTTPTFGPTKTGESRTLTLDAETVARLRAHKRAQATLKLANRTVYQDHGLVFAKEPEHLHKATQQLGQPIRGALVDQVYRLVAAAGVRRIRFHGLRHTSATLLLLRGVSVHVVAQRLGHAKPSMTWDVYSHVLPGQDAAAAAELGAVLNV